MSGSVSLRSWLDLGLRPVGLVAVPGPEGLIVTTPQPGAAIELSPSQKRVAARIENKLDQPASYQCQNLTLSEFASHFEEETGENFVLDPTDRMANRLDPNTKISGKSEGGSLREVLRAFLAPLGVEVVVRDEVVVLSKPTKP